MKPVPLQTGHDVKDPKSGVSQDGSGVADGLLGKCNQRWSES